MARFRFQARGVPHGLAALMLVLVVSVSAQQPQAPSGALPSIGTGLIAGQVVDSGSGKPIPEAQVTLRVGAPTGPESPLVLADAQGRFVFVNVPAGRYGVSAAKMGYSGCSSGEVGIADGQVLIDVVARCQKWAVISGTVTDEAGQPVVGVRVDAFKKTVAFGEIRLFAQPFVDPATTDDRGMFRILNLLPGEYAVGVPTTLTTFPSEIMPGIQESGTLRNQAFYALGDVSSPLGDARNQQVGDSVLFIGPRTPIPPPPSGSRIAAVYRTTFAPGTSLPAEASVITIRSGEERSGLSVVLRPSQAVRVSGRLVGPDGPLAHAVLTLCPAGPLRTAYCSVLYGATGSALTDAAGLFTLLGVPDGEYVVSMQTGNPQNGILWANESVTAAGADIVDLMVTARRGPRVTGRFEFRTGTPPDPNAATGPPSVSVSGDSIDPGASAFSLVGRGSDFRFAAFVVPGRYSLRFRAASTSCTAAIVDGRDVADGVFVMGAEDIEMTILCGEPASRLAGVARKPDGVTDPETVVVAFPTERAYWSGPDIRPRRLVQVNTDRSGAFTLVNLPAGDYFVAAIPVARSELWRDPRFLDQLTRSATRITLAQGESRTIDLRTVQVR